MKLDFLRRRSSSSMFAFGRVCSTAFGSRQQATISVSALPYEDDLNCSFSLFVKANFFCLSKRMDA
jgi:hypothetical protein